MVKALPFAVALAALACLGIYLFVTAPPELGEREATAERIPICLFRIGAVAPAAIEESQRTGKPLPSLHSNKFAPVPEPTIKTGITAMTAAALDLLAKK